MHDGTKVDSIVHYGRRRPALLQSVLDLGDPPDFDGPRCSAEGCDRRLGLEWDHRQPVAHGGSTTWENLQPLCDRHHADKTTRELSLDASGTGDEERGPPR
jgi:5-methylcytosine-specific restriction endonuclease McrA